MVLALGLAPVVGELGDGLAVAADQLHHDVQVRDADVVGQVGAVGGLRSKSDQAAIVRFKRGIY